MPSYQILINGSVFKTGFRYYLKEKAEQNGITGRIFYEKGSAVGIVASGTEQGLKRFIESCNVGNPLFRINKLEVVETPPAEFSSFEVEDDDHACDTESGHRHSE